MGGHRAHDELCGERSSMNSFFGVHERLECRD